MAMHRQRMPPRMGEMAAILSKSLSARLGRGTHPLWEQEDGRQVRTQELSSGAIPFRPESRKRGDHPQQRAVHVKGRGLERHRVGEAERAARSEEHTPELQSLMRISYAVF